MCLGCPDRDYLNNLKIYASKIRHPAFENSRFDLTESIYHFIFVFCDFVIKADICSLAEAAPPQPQDNVAMNMSTMKVSIGLPFPQQKNIHVSTCLRRCFNNLNTEQVSAAGQAKTQLTRAVIILIAGKRPHSRFIFCCTLHPRDLY